MPEFCLLNFILTNTDRDGTKLIRPESWNICVLLNHEIHTLRFYKWNCDLCIVSMIILFKSLSYYCWKFSKRSANESPVMFIILWGSVKTHSWRHSGISLQHTDAFSYVSLCTSLFVTSPQLIGLCFKFSVFKYDTFFNKQPFKFLY